MRHVVQHNGLLAHNRQSWGFAANQSNNSAIIMLPVTFLLGKSLYLNSLYSYRIFLVLRYEYMRKNATTAPTIIPAVVSQNANCNKIQLKVIGI